MSPLIESSPTKSEAARHMGEDLKARKARLQAMEEAAAREELRATTKPVVGHLAIAGYPSK